MATADPSAGPHTYPPAPISVSAEAAPKQRTASPSQDVPPSPTPMSGPTLPLTYDSLLSAHAKIKPSIHETPVLTSTAISEIASTARTPEDLMGTRWEGQTPARPRMRFFFKCENMQKIGAFKIRGATHALARLRDEDLRNGVLTHSSGNHAQALALAAKQKGIPAHIVMPTISQPAKIAATKGYGAHVYFSGSTEPERAAVAARVQAETGAVFVPPYDHPHIILGQGTMGLELEDQVADILEDDPSRSAHHMQTPALLDSSASSQGSHSPTDTRPFPGLPDGAPQQWPSNKSSSSSLDAVIAPLGGGGMLAGVALAFGHSQCWVFGAEPSEGGADDGRRGLQQGKRIEHVSSLTIADGLRTPVGRVPWSIISDTRYVRGLHSVSDLDIARAMRLILERLKVVVEPSAAVPLAVALYDEGFRGLVQAEGGAHGWDIGIVLSGGNTTVQSIAALFGQSEGEPVSDGVEKARELPNGGSDKKNAN